ncbi:hypothetical protein Avbf_01943 [Armadillidium vulgare]|nr:hypothetical protein Avbf_01943 [Armadillidium vulgare]
MMIDVGVDTEDSSAVAISSAAMSKLKICKKIMQFYAYIIPKLFPTEDSNTTSFHVKRTAYKEKNLRKAH